MRSHRDCHTSGTVGAQWPMRAVLVPSRVNDSDDLIMTESEVGKIALHIEKEMFNLFQVTDNRYKSRYRSIMFNLKDPKNQVCASSPARGPPASGFSGRSSQCSLDTASGSSCPATRATRPPPCLSWARGAGSHVRSGHAWSHQPQECLGTWASDRLFHLNAIPSAE